MVRLKYCTVHVIITEKEKNPNTIKKTKPKNLDHIYPIVTKYFCDSFFSGIHLKLYTMS